PTRGINPKRTTSSTNPSSTSRTSPVSKSVRSTASTKATACSTSTLTSAWTAAPASPSARWKRSSTRTTCPASGRTSRPPTRPSSPRVRTRSARPVGRPRSAPWSATPSSWPTPPPPSTASRQRRGPGDPPGPRSLLPEWLVGRVVGPARAAQQEPAGGQQHQPKAEEQRRVRPGEGEGVLGLAWGGEAAVGGHHEHAAVVLPHGRLEGAVLAQVHRDLLAEGPVGVGLDVELVGGLLAGLDVDHPDPDLLVGRQSLAGHDQLGALGAGEHQRLGGPGGRDREDEEPGKHQQELGERLATHQGDASLRQAWLAMV